MIGRALGLVVAIVLVALNAFAQPAAKPPAPKPPAAKPAAKPAEKSAPAPTGADATALPPGHPPTGGDPAGGALPPGHPPTAGDPARDALPPGHPPTGAPPSGGDGAEALPSGHPPVRREAGTAAANLPRDTSAPDPELPRGTLVATVADASGKPIANVPVRLGILIQSVAEGEKREFKNAATDADGKVRFDGLEVGSKFSYRITVKSDPAEYASAPINLREDIGHSALLHVFPVTSDIKRARVAMRVFMVVEPRDDVFQLEVMVRVFNVGAVTWVPRDVVMSLPTGWKAFNAEESMSDTRAVASGSEGIALTGTFSPGQHDVAFRFQVPNEHDPSTELAFGLPPHVGEAQVMVAAARGMNLEVPGFSPAESATTQDGRRVLVTAKQVRQADQRLDELIVRLSGIPTPSQGRWFAVAIAAGLLLAGASAVARGRSGPVLLAEKDASRARSLLLAEIVALEKARRAKEIGPRTYETARRALVDALARLEAQSPPKSSGRTKGRARARASA